MSLINRFDERDCGCIVRGDGQWLRYCRTHGDSHTKLLLAKYPGVDKSGAKQVRRGQGHTAKTVNSEPRRRANHIAREKAMGNLKEKSKK